MRLVTPALLCALASKDSWCHCQSFTHLLTVQMYRDVITNVSVLIYWFPHHGHASHAIENLWSFCKCCICFSRQNNGRVSHPSIQCPLAVGASSSSPSIYAIILSAGHSFFLLVTELCPLSFPHSQACERSRRFHLNVGSSWMAKVHWRKLDHVWQHTHFWILSKCFALSYFTLWHEKKCGVGGRSGSGGGGEG